MKKQNRVSFLGAIIRNFFLQIKRKIVGLPNFRRKKYYDKKILNGDEGNLFILKNLQSNNHFYIARLGDAELRLLFYEEARRKKIIRRVPNKIRKVIYSNAGMFSTDNFGISLFYDAFIESLPNITGLCVWYNFMEDYFFKKFAPNSELMDLDSLEAFLYENPWTYGLSGKKVLVVSPFADSIYKQYSNKREVLYKNKRTLPEFCLKVYKAKNTIEGEHHDFATWTETLEHMANECLKIDFDIAILGCGAYGLPLANKLFAAGKSVIHAGGVTQIFFGVRGRRWDSREYMKEYINESWVRPSDSEKPSNADKVENGCYW